MTRTRRPGLMSRTWRSLADTAEDRTARGASRLRQWRRDLLNGGRFTCSCGAKSCPGTFRSLRLQKAHAARIEAGRWMSAKARKVGRQMGKARDDARRTARAMWEAAGLRDHRGKLTDRARSRPAARGSVTIAQLRQLHRHDRDHERAGTRDRKADQAAAKGRPERAQRHQHRADYLRSKHGTPPREARDRAPQPGPAGNGARPAPAGTREDPEFFFTAARNGRTGRTPR